MYIYTYVLPYVPTAKPMKMKSHKSAPQIVLSPEAQKESFVNSAKTGTISPIITLLIPYMCTYVSRFFVFIFLVLDYFRYVYSYR